MDLPMLLVKALVLGIVFAFLVAFFIKKIVFDTTQGAVNRLNRETEQVRAKQSELNVKIKEASEELNKRRAEADALVAKMREDAEAEARKQRDAIVEKARKEGEEIIAKAQKTKEDMRKALERDLELKAVDFSVIVLREIFSEKTAAAINDTLILDFFKNLDQVDMSMIDEKITSAEVVSALPLEAKYKDVLSSLIKRKLGRDIQFTYVQDKELVCGLVLKFGSLALNGSFTHILKEKGMEIKEKVERGLLKTGKK